jgi:hypothetical protein
MKRLAWGAGISLTVLWLALPASAAEPGINETSSMTPSEDLSHADFAHTITNDTDGAIEIAPRVLQMGDYPIITVTMITFGSFVGGIWTIGTLDAGETATIVYVGDAAPNAAPSTTTTPPTTAVAVAVDTRSVSATEELPFTGPREHLWLLALAGVSCLGLGASLLHIARD